MHLVSSWAGIDCWATATFTRKFELFNVSKSKIEWSSKLQLYYLLLLFIHHVNGQLKVLLTVILMFFFQDLYKESFYYNQV